MHLTNVYFLGLLLYLTLRASTLIADDIEDHPNYKLIPKDCGLSYSDKIIGGNKAELGQFPWLIRLGFQLPNCTKKILYRCDGVIINERYVVTAAHCATELPTIKCPYTNENITFVLGNVLAGEYDAKTEKDCDGDVCADPVQSVKPIDVMVHEKYNNPQYANDIALIRLEEKLQLNEWVSPICLPSGKQLKNYYTNEIVQVAGWGTVNVSKPASSSVPMVVKIPILETSECVKSFAVKLTINQEQQMCAGGQEDKDSCGGDSGGPLMIVEPGDGPPRYYLIGTVSFGVKHCGKKGKPAIYTRIAGYMKWILDHIEP